MLESMQTGLEKPRFITRMFPIHDHQPVNGGVIHLNPPFLHEFFNMARAQRIRHIPTYAHENDILWEMNALEAHRHRLSPSLATTDHEGRSYRKSPQMKTCDRTWVRRWL